MFHLMTATKKKEKEREVLVIVLYRSITANSSCKQINALCVHVSSDFYCKCVWQQYTLPTALASLML